jgi:hypothetical protein
LLAEQPSYPCPLILSAANAQRPTLNAAQRPRLNTEHRTPNIELDPAHHAHAYDRDFFGSKLEQGAKLKKAAGIQTAYGGGHLSYFQKLKLRFLCPNYFP